ncbi:DUF6711 family protein [Anaeromassilibacillus sp. An250]|uniref:DUF6711 family protein n=1 Tax=Anaeromassilibacillus sp. An250 TaxID=1965604 RepID=UPI000B3AE39D|nr:hypothetical protein B5F54_07680 [Anaeromassilibacillus sp. An250]
MLIDGKEPRAPDSIQFALQDLSSENSGRDMAGTMHKDVVAQKRSLNCKWGPMTMQDCAFLLKLVNKPTFDVTYPDLLDGKPETRKFYVGDRTVPILRIREDDVYVSSVSFNFIEV